MAMESVGAGHLVRIRIPVPGVWRSDWIDGLRQAHQWVCCFEGMNPVVAVLEVRGDALTAA